MANNGGTVIADTDKLMVSTFYGGAGSLQTQLRAALADNDVIISANVTHGSGGQKLTVVWYNVVL
tara:strand:- start:126 stop:320 length:195 start_codon:yes stop_codon:yes gene_type:complete